jgi:hypothetical protein
LVLDDQTYLFRVEHQHDHPSSTEPRVCVEVFVAYVPSPRRHSIRLRFPAGKDQFSPWPGHIGGVCDYRAPRWYLNLNRPRVARFLIELAISLGWPHASDGRHLVVADGYAFIRSNRGRLDALFADDAASRSDSELYTRTPSTAATPSSVEPPAPVAVPPSSPPTSTRGTQTD